MMASPAKPRLGALTGQVSGAGRYLAHAMRMVVGVPDYGNYVRHRELTHPGEPVMSYEAFLRDRQRARYEGGTGRCC